eukprot:7838446-Pyramimonas_sp.AAC.1
MATQARAWIEASSGHDVGAMLEKQWKRLWCTCDESGKVSWAMKNKFLREMKSIFAPRPRGLEDVLQSGSVVVKIVGHKLVDVGPSASGWAAVSAHKDEEVDSVTFLHIGSMLFNPYQPTYQNMEVIPCPWPSIEADGRARG